MLNHRAVGRACLQDDQALAPFSASTSSHLHKHLERAFVGAEVGLVEHRIGIEDAYDRDTVEVEALRHHLRADEDVIVACRKI